MEKITAAKIVITIISFCVCFIAFGITFTTLMDGFNYTYFGVGVVGLAIGLIIVGSSAK